MENEKVTINLGFGLLPLTFIFIILKVTETVAWSWLWVLCPLWIGPAFVIAIIAGIFLFMAVVLLISFIIALID